MNTLKTEYGIFTNNEITGQTAQEVYEERMSNYDFVDGKWIPKQIDNCSEPTDKERITKLEEEKSILAENVYQLASILEIMLGGTADGQTEATTTDTAN